MNPINGIHFRRREIGDDIDSVQQVAGKFFEILDLADLVHFIDNSIQYGLDLLVCFLLKERPLAFQPALMPEKFLLVKGRDLFLSALCTCHEGRTITPHRVSLQVSF
jgi:hypothetical protein